jgi:hypothetical protein
LAIFGGAAFSRMDFGNIRGKIAPNPAKSGKYEFFSEEHDRVVFEHG